jgi:hypothetical protein
MESKKHPLGQVVYVFEFEILPGKEDEFWQFMEKEGTPFWLSYPEIESYDIYSKLGGYGTYEAHVVINELGFMDKLLTNPLSPVLGKKTHELTQNIQRRFLRLAKVYVKDE